MSDIAMSTDNVTGAFINAEICNEILQICEEETEMRLKFLNCTVRPALEVKGFLGEYYKLQIKCNKIKENKQCINNLLKLKDVNENLNSDEAKLIQNMDFHFFLKKLPFVDELHESIVIFRKEATLYKTLLKKLEEYSSQKWFPKLYYATEKLLILQDLGKENYNNMANEECLHDHHIRAILQGLANMHAASLINEYYEKTNIGNTYRDCLEEITVHPEIPWYTVGVKALYEIAKSHPNYQNSCSQQFIKNKLPKYFNSIFYMVNTSLQYRNVLCHRDLWGGNIFVKDINNSAATAIFVDFQTCRYCPPAIDLVFVLFMNLEKEMRLKTQAEYLKFYCHALKENLSKFNLTNEMVEVSEAEIFQTYQEFQLFGLVYRALAVSILKVPQTLVTEDYKNKERSQALMNYMMENREFGQSMEQCVADIIEAVLIKE